MEIARHSSWGFTKSSCRDSVGTQETILQPPVKCEITRQGPSGSVGQRSGQAGKRSQLGVGLARPELASSRTRVTGTGAER